MDKMYKKTNKEQKQARLSAFFRSRTILNSCEKSAYCLRRSPAVMLKKSLTSEMYVKTEPSTVDLFPPKRKRDSKIVVDKRLSASLAFAKINDRMSALQKCRNRFNINSILN